MYIKVYICLCINIYVTESLSYTEKPTEQFNRLILSAFKISNK